jgi:hypothetical protein
VDAVVYDPQSVGGIHAIFVTRGDPWQFNLPPAPECPTAYLKKGWTSAAVGAGLLIATIFTAFLSTKK